MKLSRNVIPILVAVLAATPVWAGDDERAHKKCDADASECISKMVETLSQRGWIGIEWDDEAEQPVLTQIIPNSPAEAAGLRKGDLLLAFNGVPTDAGEEAVWAEAKKSLIPDKTITLTIQRNGAEKVVNVKLAQLPRSVMAQWVGNHVIEHHVIAEKENEEKEADAPRP